MLCFKLVLLSNERVISVLFLLGFKTASRPFLLNVLCGTFELQVFIEAHHALDILLDDLSEHILFEKFARLHGIEKEVFREFLRQVGFDNLVDLLLLFGSDSHRRSRAIDKRSAVHIERNALNRHIAWVENVGALQDILLFLTEHKPLECKFEGDFGFDSADGTIVEKFLEVVFILNFQPIERTADSLEQGCLTTAVHTADKDYRAVALHRQVEVEREIRLIVADFYVLDYHSGRSC